MSVTVRAGRLARGRPSAAQKVRLEASCRLAADQRRCEAAQAGLVALPWIRIRVPVPSGSNVCRTLIGIGPFTTRSAKVVGGSRAVTSTVDSNRLPRKVRTSVYRAPASRGPFRRTSTTSCCQEDRFSRFTTNAKTSSAGARQRSSARRALRPVAKHHDRSGVTGHPDLPCGVVVRDADRVRVRADGLDDLHVARAHLRHGVGLVVDDVDGLRRGRSSYWRSAAGRNLAHDLSGVEVDLRHAPLGVQRRIEEASLGADHEVARPAPTPRSQRSFSDCRSITAMSSSPSRLRTPPRPSGRPRSRAG